MLSQVHNSLVSAHVDTGGIIHAPTLYRSSGNSEYDKAILSCAESRPIVKMLVEGNPANLDITVGYYVGFASSWFAPALVDGQPAVCGYPFRLIRKRLQGSFTFTFNVDTQGATKNVTLTKSEGSGELADSVSEWCAHGDSFQS